MLKMNELVSKSGVSKSTILYYIKEGLLPEPQKPKPNLHLYHENTIEKIALIQYLQKNFNSSISELKAIFSHEDFDIEKPYESLLNVLDVLMGADFTKTYSKKELCESFNISEKKLDNLIKDGFLHVRDGLFTQCEFDMLNIIVNSNKKEKKLIEKYISLSQELSVLEVELGLEILENKKNLKQLFDIMLILKPYIFNMQTLSTYKKEKKI